MANINQWKVGDIISASKLNEMVNAINSLLQQEIPEIDTSNLITTEQLTTILQGYSDVGHTHHISEIVDLVLPTVPTKLSQLENDTDFATITQVNQAIANAQLGGGQGTVDLSSYAKKTDIPTKTSQLQNDSDFATNASVDEKIANVSTGGATITSLILGNYEIKYNSTDDTLDFLYKGAIDEPTEETVALTWAVGNLNSSGAEIVQDNALRSDFVTIEDNYIYSFHLGTSFYDPTGVRVYFYDTNKTFISRTDGDALGYTTGTDIPIDIPSNAAYMRFKSNAAYNTTVDTISSLFTLKKANDEIVIPTWNDGKSIAGATGGIIVNEAAMVTDLITIDNNYNYTIRYNPTTTNEVRIAFYDSSQGFISRSNYLTSGNEDTLITFPENTAYFRIKSEKVGITVNEANNNIIIKKVKKVNKVNSYVREGLSMYIDASDVAIQGSVRDITGKQTIVNHGVSTTLDNSCLNFVASESDYIDGGFKPNLTKWSAEAYFYFTTMPTEAETLLGWGASGNRTAIGIWGNTFMIAINGNVEHTIMPTAPTSLTHIVLTYNNGTIIAYVNGAKSQIATNANLMSSQAGNLMIGTKYSAAGEFGNIHLKSLRFYDGKVLTDEEALQNYNYETNRNDEVVSVTWIYNKKPNSTTGELVDGENNACTEFIPYDNSYNYTLAIDSVAFFRVFYYDSSQSYIKNDSIADNFNGVITPPENTVYMRLKLGRNNLELTDLDNHVILRKTLK